MPLGVLVSWIGAFVNSGDTPVVSSVGCCGSRDRLDGSETSAGGMNECVGPSGTSGPEGTLTSGAWASSV